MIVKKIDIDIELKHVEKIFKDKKKRIEESKNRHLNIRRRKGKR